MKPHLATTGRQPVTYRDHADLRAQAAADVGREVITEAQRLAMTGMGSITNMRDPYAIAEAARLERANAWRRKAGLPER